MVWDEDEEDDMVGDVEMYKAGGVTGCSCWVEG